ncbi:MAG: type II secretion system protein GspG [Methyloprofundus sp.]|nr:type II secretion system protein GspG [Methyloprofundus sp.]MBW6453428.1 type II secretion system protein GspG [Methyloprofundus sp.]
MDRPDIARLTKAKQDIRVIESALNLYKLDKFNYPTTEEGLEILQPKYLDRLPKDPWGNVYLYLSPDERSKDGDGMNADLGNWDTD